MLLLRKDACIQLIIEMLLLSVENEKQKKNTEVIEGNARGSRKTIGEIFPVSGNGKHRLINLSVEVWGGERAAEESSDGFGYLVRDDLYFGNDTSRR